MQRIHGRQFCTRRTKVVALGLILSTFASRSDAACVGDCDGSGDVTVNELITMVNIALGSASLSSCPAADADGSGDITINEIIAAVNNALGVCPPPAATPTPTQLPVTPTPTFSLVSTFPQIQSTIFNATCLDLSCHNARDQGGGLVLESSAAYANLVGATPFNFAASQAGMLRVDSGNPTNSFLITKLTLLSVFDPQLGSRMPLGKPVLSTPQIDSIRAWILRGALADEAP